MQWSRKKLDDLVKAGKIRGWTEHKPPEPTHAGRIVAKHFKRKAPALNWISCNLLDWCQNHMVALQEEYRFDKDRKWRFDWAIPELMIAIEYEGGLLSHQSGHRSVKGINKDIQKYNRASQLGWKVYRYTAVTYENLINDLNHGS